MIKEKHRDKKKPSNGNVSTTGNAGSSSGSNNENSSVGIKPEPVDKDRELDRSEGEVKDEPTLSEESHSGDKSGSSSPALDVKTSVVATNPTTTDLCLTDAKPEEGPLLESSGACKVLKNEDGGNTESEFHPDPCEGVIPLGLSLGNSGPCPNDPLLDGVQPLASNVINKQPGTMEAQYMQQQSQIFVFSTTLANKSAESVIQGQYSSIIAYHCAQPRTKKYLEKHPLKMNQFNRQHPAQWLNNLAQLKQKTNPSVMKCLGMGRGTMKNNFVMDVGMSQPRMPMWNHVGNNTGNVMQPGNMKSGNMDNTSNMLPGSPNSNSMMQGGLIAGLADFPADTLSLGSNHSLAGVKVPDENLTPQQRQHREEQLATLRKMQQMLFPEHHSPGDNPITASNPSPTDLEEVIPLPSEAAEMMLMQQSKHQPGMIAQAEWQKLQLQFFEEKKKKGNCPISTSTVTTNNGSRTQGPPPPYHQTTRSASVPIAMPSPNPCSPTNTTSNLSLPSPRTCSGLNSPAEGKSNKNQSSGPGPSPGSPGPGNGSRSLVSSNPSTPVSTNLSPKKDKLNNNTAVPSEFSPTTAPLSQQSPVDGMFCRSLQSLVQQKQQSVANSNNKEPNLMPVPSPQQIQYLNTFEGQELTIQKQPNTSLKETNIMSPLPSSGLPTSGSEMQNKVSGPSTPLTPTSVDIGVTRYPGAGTPGEFTNPSPQPVQEKNQQRQLISNNKTEQRFPCTSPQMTDTIATSRFNMMSSSPVVSSSFAQQSTKQGPHFMDVASPNKSCVGEPGKDQSGSGYPCIGPDNVPLNPNGITRIGGGGKVSHFDPITSLAQMSQQLTNNVANASVNQHPGMMQLNTPNSNNMHLMQINDLGVCSSTGGLDSNSGPSMGIRMGNPQMGNHPHVFSPGSIGNNGGMGRVVPCQSNNPSISPKPNMMQGSYPGQPNPGGPMQQRMMNRSSIATSYNGANIQVKPSAPNTIQYLPTRPQSGNAGPRGPPSLDFLRFSNPLSNLEAKVPTHNLQYFPNSYQQNNISSNDMVGNVNYGGMGQGVGMNPGNMMIRGNVRGSPGGGMMRVGVPPITNVNFTGNEQMFPTAGGGTCQMFVPGPKGSPMGLGVAPDATQPLPPSMGQSNNFKNSSYIGPITADPNYAQQFHNFQQQLYATNTKSQMNNQGMSGAQQFFAHK